jgi:hypothetical protein
MTSKKTWQEKLRNIKGAPIVQPVSLRMSQRWETGTVAIPHQLDFDAIMKNVPKCALMYIEPVRSVHKFHRLFGK